MADSDALRARRSRAHRQGNHDLCLVGRCPELGPDATQRAAAEATARLAAAVEVEFPENDPLSRAMALRLVELSGGRGPAAVQALRALGELVAYQRDGGP